MDFRMEVALPETPDRVWAVMVDVPRIAACIPGCENVQEEARLERYSAVLKQKIGPFKLEVPAEVVVEDYDEPRQLKARAFGTDKLTRTKLGRVRRHADACRGKILPVCRLRRIAGCRQAGQSRLFADQEEGRGQFR